MAAGSAEPEQTRRRPPPKAKAKAEPPAKKTETPEIICRSELGAGVTTGRAFCDVPAATTAGEGIILCLAPHKGAATLTFDLHARHVYSEELVRAGAAFRRYTAAVVVLTMANGILGRGVVETEFRTAADLFDRIAAGDGTKAVAPMRPETIAVEIPEGIHDIAIVGERLAVARLDGSETITQPGRLIATVSNVRVTYEPAPVPMRRAGARKGRSARAR